MNPMNHRRTLRILLPLVALFATAMCPGCGEGGGGNAVGSNTPAIDPRFATAEALLEYYNQVAMTGPKVNIESIFDLLYAETGLQEQLIES